MQRTVTEIIIHCSASKVGQDFRARDIDKWHKERGWQKIGYHYVVTVDGEIETGRKPEEIGAHCINHNQSSIGVCYIGGLDKFGRAMDTRNAAQKVTLRHLIETLKVKYPDAKVYGHKDFDKNKACPSFDAKREYQ